MNQTRYTIFANPEEGPNTLTKLAAHTGDGTSMEVFLREFDGSVPVHEFPVPPTLDAYYEGEDAMELTSTQKWVIAKQARDIFRAGWELGHDSMMDSVRELARRARDAQDTDDAIRVLADLERLANLKEDDDEAEEASQAEET